MMACTRSVVPCFMFSILLVGLTATPQASAQSETIPSATDPSSQPTELGRIAWLREIHQAQDESKASEKPILLLFQEIPGCETCQTFGNQPLSHPLLVEAIEDLFVPLAIYNNKKGDDESVLLAFDEPAWNNPVIRFIDANRADIIPRQDRVWTIGGTAARMVSALEASGKTIPAYLRLVAQEYRGETETATFAMHCYWEGEGQLGKIDGVKDTQSAWVGSKEVVNVTFDPERVDYQTLLDKAQAMQCASTVFTNTDQQYEIAKAMAPDHSQRLNGEGERRVAKDSDQKYYLRKTAMRHLPLTPLQSTKINAALHSENTSQEAAVALLSPRQKQLLEKIERALRRHPKALEDLTYPADANQLSDYHDALTLRLASLES